MFFWLYRDRANSDQIFSAGKSVKVLSSSSEGKNVSTCSVSPLFISKSAVVSCLVRSSSPKCVVPAFSFCTKSEKSCPSLREMPISRAMAGMWFGFSEFDAFALLRVAPAVARCNDASAAGGS